MQYSYGGAVGAAGAAASAASVADATSGVAFWSFEDAVVASGFGASSNEVCCFFRSFLEAELALLVVPDPDGPLLAVWMVVWA